MRRAPNLPSQLEIGWVLRMQAALVMQPRFLKKVYRSSSFPGSLSPWIPSLRKTMTKEDRSYLCSDGIVIHYICPKTKKMKVPFDIIYSEWNVVCVNISRITFWTFGSHHALLS